MLIYRCMSRDSSVGISTGYGLDNGMVEVRFPAEAGNYSNTVYRSALGPVHPHIQRVLVALSLEVKRPKREADNSPPYSAEVK
jgi:hypothetical protein